MHAAQDTTERGAIGDEFLAIVGIGRGRHIEGCQRNASRHLNNERSQSRDAEQVPPPTLQRCRLGWDWMEEERRHEPGIPVLLSNQSQIRISAATSPFTLNWHGLCPRLVRMARSNDWNPACLDLDLLAFQTNRVDKQRLFRRPRGHASISINTPP